jgi:DMSO/TMAO reductase YedYZ molybdopterin-dependent catalytic subunit
MMREDIKTIISPSIKQDDRIPPGQNVTDNWPVLHYGNVPHIDISTWNFSISGLVEKEITINYRDFIEFSKIKVMSDIHCVTGWSMLDNLWEGIHTSTINQMTKILPEAHFVIVHASGGFTTNLSTKDFFSCDVLFAFKHNDELLTPEHGYPLRLVVPRLYFWKSAKWVTGIEFLSDDKPGFWESRGYHNHGDPWREERYIWGRTHFDAGL